jgi:hypothetical protein
MQGKVRSSKKNRRKGKEEASKPSSGAGENNSVKSPG